MLRSTAPSEQPKTTENSLKSEFSTPWKHSFHCVENWRNVFPLCGKNGPVFPQCGKYFSIAWKNRGKVFHTVENFIGRDPPVAAIFRKIRLRMVREMISMDHMHRLMPICDQKRLSFAGSYELGRVLFDMALLNFLLASRIDDCLCFHMSQPYFLIHGSPDIPYLGTLLIPRVSSQVPLTPVYISLLVTYNYNVFRAGKNFLASRPGFCDIFGSSEMICVRTLFFKNSNLLRFTQSSFLLKTAKISFAETRRVRRAQPWARLLVLCFSKGLRGPSEETWAWCRASF